MCHCRPGLCSACFYSLAWDCAGIETRVPKPLWIPELSGICVLITDMTSRRNADTGRLVEFQKSPSGWGWFGVMEWWGLPRVSKIYMGNQPFNILGYEKWNLIEPVYIKRVSEMSPKFSCDLSHPACLSTPFHFISDSWFVANNAVWPHHSR